MTEDWMPFYMNAFYELSTERPVGFGVGAIPWSKIREYGLALGYMDIDLDNFHTIIRTMDARYIKIKNKEHGRSQPIRK